MDVESTELNPSNDVNVVSGLIQKMEHNDKKSN
jgi:hypothetical protein